MNMSQLEIQFVRAKDFLADKNKLFHQDADEKEINISVEGLSPTSNLMIEGEYGSPFKIKKVEPVTSDLIRKTLTL